MKAKKVNAFDVKKGDLYQIQTLFFIFVAMRFFYAT